MIEISGTKYFTRKEIAQGFDVDPETISRWRREGKLKGYKVNKRKYIFSEKEIEKMIIKK
jgi:predicted site-specific integrase-resolvase